MAAVSLPLKYPKTPHLPFSPGIHHDDITLTLSQCTGLLILGQEAVLTEKLDGGNCCIYQGKVYARTVNSEATHPSFGTIKQLVAEISYLLPRNVQLFGENMVGVHTIEYNALESFFYVFAALRDGSEWLSWDHVTELTNEIGVPTVPVVAKKQFSSLNEVENCIKTCIGEESKCGNCQPEGFVIRTAQSFPYDRLERHMAKFVRAGYFQSEDSWRRSSTWKQAKLSKH